MSINSPYIDGCFIDRSDDEPDKFSGNYTFSQKTNDDFTDDHNQVLYQLQKQLDESGQSISIAKSDTIEGIAAVRMGRFEAGMRSLKSLMNYTRSGIIVQVHVFAVNTTVPCNNIINSLACFLMGASQYSYYACSKGFLIDGWLDHKEYHKPLGKPLGDATVNGNEYMRKFEGDGKTQTIVKWNSDTLVGEIYWADGSAQVGVNGSVV